MVVMIIKMAIAAMMIIILKGPDGQKGVLRPH